jgi:2',3'-cyclic-nucleotide 2'-phosphodiesterase (5'-nucleotidase family)
MCEFSRSTISTATCGRLPAASRSPINDKTRKIIVPAGGAEHMATLVQQLRQDHKNTIFVAAGDLIGASPFLSAMFHDEPTIESLSMMGLAISSVGNHEFDEGKDELLRMQNGGCHPTDGCQGTAIDLKLDRATRDVVSAKADNVIVRASVYASDPQQTALLESYDKLAAPFANRAAGSVIAALSHLPNQAGESVLGDIVADAQLAATSAETNGGAVIAFTNPGGIRADIQKTPDGKVTYGDLFASQPFQNKLVTVTLTGMQIKDALEQQWITPGQPRILQVSNGFSYSWDGTKPYGDRVIAGRMSLNGAPIDPAARYRVTVNNYLAAGGDGFAKLTEGTAPQLGVHDVDALYSFFQTRSPVVPAPASRITRLN